MYRRIKLFANQRHTTNETQPLATRPFPALSHFALTGCAVLLLVPPQSVQAETIEIERANYNLGLRVGDNSRRNRPNKVIFEVPGVPLAGGENQPVTSTNNISGGSGTFTVRFEVDSLGPPTGTAELRANSSSGITCDTPASCGSTRIEFSDISWQARDNDVMELSTRFDGSANQLVHEHELPEDAVCDPNGNAGPGQGQGQGNAGGNNNCNRNNRSGLKHRDFVRFTYSNDELLPAGTYRGRVRFTGTFP